MMDHYILENCRLCKSNKLEDILLLENSALCDEYLKKPKKQEFYPLGLKMCMDCSFVQLNTVVDPEIIYRDYIYVTTSSSGLENHFIEYCSDVCEYLAFTENKLVVDIGSNDGTLLKYFKQKNHRVIGVEPAIEIANKANNEGIKTYPKFFNNNLTEKIVLEEGKADLITVNNLFANIVDLHAFMDAVDMLLAQEGVLIIESSYLYKMIEEMVFDFIYHEHLSYLSATPLEGFMKRYGMHLINIQKVPTKGGSLRYYFAKVGSKWSINNNVNDIMGKELSVDDLRGFFIQFSNRIKQAKDDLHHYLANGKIVAGYGASATSTTLISHFKIHGILNYLVDDNPSKIETFSPGYHIPVYSSDKLRQSPPDILVILAWRYQDQIMKKIKDLSCKVVVPLPEFLEIR